VIFYSFFFKKIGAKFLKSQKRTQFVVCMQFFFSNFKTFSQYETDYLFLFFKKKKNLNTTKINQEQIFFFLVVAETLKKKKLRKTRNQILDVTRSKENPRITCNNNN
jgi:hypothetical protein